MAYSNITPGPIFGGQAISSKCRWKDLDCYLAIQVSIKSSIDLTHSAFTDLLMDLVAISQDIPRFHDKHRRFEGLRVQGWSISHRV